MRQRSPAFRRQIARIGAAPMLRIRILPEDRVRPLGVDARTVCTFNGDTLVNAHVYLRMPSPELIAHEMEHIVEQLDGIDLRAQAGNGVAWKSHDNAFETSRAIRAARLVAQEVARGGGRGTPPVAAAGGSSAAIAQREHHALPLSERTARLSADGRFIALISAARAGETTGTTRIS
jgi:hypothetical protein